MIPTEHDTLALVWDGSRGYMSHGGVRMILRQRPTVSALLPFHEIHYVPRTGLRRVKRNADWTDLSNTERYAIETWLQRWSNGSRQSIAPWDGKTERRSVERRGTQHAALLTPQHRQQPEGET